MSGKLIVRSELEVPSVDSRPSSKAVGWTMEELVGIAVVNPRPGTRMTVTIPPIDAVLLERPLPGRSDYVLRSTWVPVLAEKKPGVRVEVEDTRKRITRDVRRLGVFDLRQDEFESGEFEGLDGGDLHSQVMGLDPVARHEGPSSRELAGDSFWAAYLQDLWAAWTTHLVVSA